MTNIVAKNFGQLAFYLKHKNVFKDNRMIGVGFYDDEDTYKGITSKVTLVTLG